MENVFSMDGKLVGNFRGIPIDIDKNLIPIKAINRMDKVGVMCCEFMEFPSIETS